MFESLPMDGHEEKEENPDTVLAELRKKFNPKKPAHTAQLRTKLRSLCKGVQITEELRAELLTLGYGKSELGIQETRETQWPTPSESV
jgi:hypothetical protein